MNFVGISVIICCLLTLAVSATSSGDWGKVEYCPNDESAVGFHLKAEPPQGGSDDAALNAISLQCSGGSWITSSEGSWGNWGDVFVCPSESRLTSCQLQFEPRQGNGDDTAANNLNCKCSNGETLYGDGTSWGEWNDWSHDCSSGICALQTRVKTPQGDGEETPLNEVALTCCQ